MVQRVQQADPAHLEQQLQHGAGNGDSLTKLAGEISSEQSAPAPLSPDQQQQLQEAEAKFDQLMANLGKFADKALRAVRAKIAVKLPEIRNEWTDADLAAFAECIPPVIEKRLAILAPILGGYPEECALVLAAVPLGMGYVSALSDHQEKGETRQIAGAPIVPAPRAAAAPADPPGGPVFHVGGAQPVPA